MRQRTRLVLNSLVNVMARVITVATRFAIVPFAIAVLGRDVYGTWIIVGQIFAYTRLLELGLRAAVTRQVAFRLARDEPEVLNRYMNTAGAFYFVVAGVVFLLAVVVSIFFPDWFDVPPDLRTASRVMVLVAGGTLACTIPTYAYGAIASGLQRYGIISATQIGADLLRLAIVLLLLKHVTTGGGMVLLAVAAGGSVLIGALVRTGVSFRLWPGARFAPWKPDRSLLREMVSFGVNTAVFVTFASAAGQLAQIIIGAFMSTAQATDFRLAMEMIAGVHVFVVALTVSIIPAAGKFHGEQNADGLRTLLVRSTRYASALSLVGVVGLVSFAEVFLTLWQGANYPGEQGAATIALIAKTTTILAIGHGLFWLLLPAFNVVNGVGKHRVPAALALGAGLVGMLLVVAVACRDGASIDTVAWVVVLPIIPAWLVVLPMYCCGVVGQPMARFTREGVLIPMLGCLPAAAVAQAFYWIAPAETWWGFLAQLGICGLVFVPCGWWIILAREDRRDVVQRLRSARRGGNAKGQE